MGEVVDKEDVNGEEENRENITVNNLTMKIIEFWYNTVNKKGDGQEDTAYAATDCVDDSEDVKVLNQTALMFCFFLSILTL